MLLKYPIKLLLIIHSFTYRVIGYLASKNEPNGLHPKHRITKYHQFFMDNITETESVLDIGCGNGAMTYDMAIIANFVTGIDINKKRIEEARKKYEGQNLIFLHGELSDLWHEAQVDVITLSNVLEHIENRTEFLNSLKRFEPKKILIRVPLFTRDWITQYKKEMGVDYRLDKSHYIEYKQSTFLFELKKAGLKADNIETRYGELFACCSVA